jgi:glycosyltransferase involved in cell wall biosynthesis
LSLISNHAYARNRLLYFYLSRARQGNEYVRSGEPCFNLFEFRFLDVLSKKNDVTVAFFTPSGRISRQNKIAPDNVALLPLRDFPFVSYFPLPMRLLIETLTRTLRIALLIRILRPDIVVGNWITRLSGLYCAFVGFHPFLAIAWGDDVLIEPRRSRFMKALARFTLRVADAVIVDSQVQRSAVLGLGCKPSKIYCFPWGIDLDKFGPGKPTQIRRDLQWLNQRIVISTRHHYPMYAVECLIRAIPTITTLVKDAKFVLVGDGPCLSYHKSLARELRIEDQVKFLGFVPNEVLPGILNAADVYVSTSLSDGSSASLMEAMACGLPVVVTNIPANKEWVNDGQNGFLVPPGDSLALARSVARILQDDMLRLRMKKANLDLAQRRLDWRVNSSILEQCVSDLLSRNETENSRASN